MKVIDLLNKIANGEDLPEKIRYDEKIWKLNPLNDTYDNGECCLFEDYIDKKYVITDVLNDEVEVIEEDKKIKNLKSYISCGWNGTCKDLKRGDLFNDLEKIGTKINEIIDYINKEK